MKILVIGRGGMGKLFARVMNKDGRELELIGHADKRLTQKARSAKVIVLATPTNKAEKMRAKLANVPELSEKLLICLSSYMQGAKGPVEKLGAPVVYLHFLFGPDIQVISGQNIAIAGDYKNKLFKPFAGSLQKNNANLHFCTADFHDRIMAYSQSLSQYSSIMLGHALAQSKYSYDQLHDYASLTFRLNRYTVERIMRQKAELWAELQFENEHYPEVLKKYLKTNEKMIQAVTTRDEKLFTRLFEQAAEFWRAAARDEFVPETAKTTNEFSKNKPADFATLGPPGTFSHYAVAKLKPDARIDFTGTIAEALSRVFEGRARKALVPIENSQEGAVSETLDRLYLSGLKIEDELEIDIHHSLCALERPQDARQIQAVYSHPQALGQCSAYLARNYPQAKLVPTSSTVAGMQAISEQKDLFALAIGPQETAKKHHLIVVDKNIEDKTGNKTRFVVCSQKPSGKKPLKTTLVALVPKTDRPGLLHDILSAIKEEKINMSQIDSRPNPRAKGKYIFYVRLDIPSADKKFARIVAKIVKNNVTVKKISV